MILIEAKPGCFPTRGTEGSAGFDLYADKDVTLKANAMSKVPVGIKSQFSRHYVALIWDRSGLGAKGIHRHCGVIDSDYRGEWVVALHNTTSEDYEVKKGDRVAQFILQKVSHELIPGKVEDSARGSGGFGSTGT